MTVRDDTLEFVYSLPFTRHEVGCPYKDCLVNEQPFLLYRSIIHLNDRHKWSREAIADWLDTLPLDLTIGERA